VVELGARSLAHALTAVGERLRVPSVRAIPPGWCSWSYYFLDVTDADVRENVDAAERLGLPIEIVQLDDGWEAGIGDWLDVSPRFGSLADVAAFVRASGRVPGIWTAPFLVGTRSRLAAEHPDWLVPELDAGENWGQPLRVLDVSKPAAAAHLRHVYERLRELGFGFHKLDFLYAGALAGLDAYREGLRIIRAAAGDATLLGCGAPLLPSIGLVDAMRVGPDVIGEDASRWSRSIAHAREVTAARAWMNGRLWTSDPDHLLARPEVPDRDLWAAHVAEYDGVVLSGDRLSALDAHGVELTRRALVA
jgi:alpha-galactosidase